MSTKFEGEIAYVNPATLSSPIETGLDNFDIIST